MKDNVNIKHVTLDLEDIAVDNLLFVHALTGCGLHLQGKNLVKHQSSKNCKILPL